MAAGNRQAAAIRPQMTYYKECALISINCDKANNVY